MVTRKIDGMTAAEKKFLATLDPVQQRIFRAVMAQVNDLATTHGIIDFDASNAAQVNELNKIVRDTIKKTAYSQNVADYLREFETISKYNTGIHEDLNALDPKEIRKLINPIQKQMVDQTVEGLLGTGINTGFTDPMKEGIMANIASGVTKSQLEDSLRAYILANPDQVGAFTRYAGQIARDTLNQFDGQVNSRIMADFGLNAMRYVGSIIDDSRPQCIRWVGMGTLLVDELPQEIEWANANGSGMVKGTTPGNFATFRGGYNCRHSAIPFKMTKSQLAEYEKAKGKKTKKAAATTSTKVTQQTQQVTKQIDQTQAASQKMIKNGTLDPLLVVSSITGKKLDVHNAMIEAQNGAVEVIHKHQTGMGLLTRAEAGKPGRKLNEAYYKGKNVSMTRLPSVGKDAGGVATRNNAGMTYVCNPNDHIIARGYDDEFFERTTGGVPPGYAPVSFDRGRIPGFWKADTKESLFTVKGKNKPFSMSSVSKKVDGNMAPTITHEVAHIIQNDKGRDWADARQMMQNEARNLGLTLSDAPTFYGQTNWAEFWTESFTAYVHAPKWFESEHPGAFKLFHVMLGKYNIDPKTIQQYFNKS